MGLSATHLLILLAIVILVFGPSRIPGLGKSLGEGLRNFKKGIKGEGDIDVTDSARKIEDEKKRS